MSLYDSLPGTHPDRHLADDELEWLELDPSGIVAFIRNASVGADEDLARRFEGIHRAAWGCESYLQFAPHLPRRRWPSNPIVVGELDELVVDLDREGHPIGLEFTSKTCRSGPAAKRIRWWHGLTGTTPRG